MCTFGLRIFVIHFKCTFFKLIYDCLINLIDYWEDHLSKLLILITIILETNKKIPD